MVLGLVRLGPVDPAGRVGAVDVAGPDRGDLARPRRRQELELDHRRDLGREVGQRRQDDVFGNGADRRPLLGRTAAPLQGSRRRPAWPGTSPGVEFLAGRPAEHPPDAVDVLVDQLAAAARLDHGLADGLQGQGAEVAGEAVAVEPRRNRRAWRMLSCSLVGRPSLT